MLKFVLSFIIVILTVQFSNNASVDIFKNKFKKSSDDTVGLYSIRDDVEILTIHNFKSLVYGSKSVWFVEFYNSYCGFCQRFAPSWKEFATEIKLWKNLIVIAAIDCANEENNPLCRDLEIMGYPTLKYFHEEYTEGPKNLGLTVRAGSGAIEHKKKLLDTVETEQKEGRGKYIPSLLPYTESTPDNLLNNVASSVKYVFLVIQEPGSYIGQLISLDLHNVSDVVVRYAFNDNKELMSNINIQNSPAVVFYNENKVLNELKINEDPKKTITNYLHLRSIDVKNNEEVEAVNKNEGDVAEPSQEDILLAKIKKMGNVVFQKDLETALRYSLKKEVSRTKEITGDKLEALKKYINVLIKYFPFGKYGQSFLMDLKHFLDEGGNTVKGADVYKKVKEAEKEENQVFSSPEGWLACKGSEKTYRGYSCGLWTLFHYLTVNHADHNVDNKNANPLEVLEAMHGYIKEFFGCTDCSSHFQEMAERRNWKSVDSLSNSVLWLWSAHNEVNNRLAGDSTEDPKFPKVQFPPKERCPSCHLDDDSWDTAEVLKYLKHMYSNINVRYNGSDTRILHLGLEGAEITSGSTSFFQTIDTSMCFIIYVISFALILFLIRMFLKRGYRKKAYVHDLLGKV